MTHENYVKAVDTLNRASQAYYNGNGAEVLNDKEYDLLYREVTDFEKRNNIVNKNSPSFKIGYPVNKKDGFAKKNHLTKMYSIKDSMIEAETEKWCSKIIAEYGEVEFYSQLKYDGASLNLIYKNGVLISAITRGDGTTGDEVLENAKEIQGVPSSISYVSDIPLEVRGEVLMSYVAFEENQKLREKEGKELFANPRNAASGSLRQKNSEEVKKRDLFFVPYGLGTDFNNNFSTQLEISNFISSLGGFNDVTHSWICKNTKEVLEAFKTTAEIRSSLPFGIDGMVVKVNKLSIQEELGFGAKYPNFILACKLKAVEMITTVIDIITQVGKDGTQTPVCIVKPVDIDGSIVSKATLFNWREVIKVKDIRIGDQVSIIKGGDIIPSITKVHKNRRTGVEKVIKAPTHCISCNSPLEKEVLQNNQDGVSLFCVNKNCEARLSRYIEYIAERTALNIDTLGTEAAKQLVVKKNVKNILDLLSLGYDDFLQLDGFGSKKAEKLHHNIQNIVGNRTIDKVIVLLQSKDLGKTIAEKMALDLKFDAFIPEKVEAYSMVGISKEVFLNYASLLRERESYVEEVINALKPTLIEVVEVEQVSNVFQGKKIAITGTLDKKRNDYVKIIEEHGGTFSAKVNKQTDVLCIGDNVGSNKISAAKKLGVRIVPYQDFFRDIA